MVGQRWYGWHKARARARAVPTFDPTQTAWGPISLGLVGSRGGARPSLQGIKARGGNGGLEPFSCRTFDVRRATRALDPVTLARLTDVAAKTSTSVDEVCVEPLSGVECELRKPSVGMARADRALARLGGRQHGVVSRRQLLAAGLGRRAIGSRIERGSLHSIHRGVYAVGHAKLSTEGRWLAAVLSFGPEALLSHRSAARLWRLIPGARSAAEVTRPGKCRPRVGFVVHRSHVPEDERTIVDGIPVTTVPRTILDLAAVVGKRQVERAFNEAEVQRLTDPLSIPDLLDRYPGRRGTAVLREMLGDEARISGVTRNDFEERFVAFVDANGLPCPHFNADIAVRGRFFVVDCLWPEARLIVELDGRAVHGTRRAFEADRERDRLLLADGWRVVRITWRQLDAGAGVAADLRRLLAQREAH